MISLDCETKPFSPGNQFPPLVCVQANGEIYHVNDALPVVESIFASGDTIIGHSIAYDMLCIVRQWPHLLRPMIDAYTSDRVVCTEVLCKLRDIADGSIERCGDGGLSYSLAACVKRELGIDIEGKGTTQLTYGDLIGLPVSAWPAEHVRYAREDTYWPARLYALPRPYPLPDLAFQTRSALWCRLASGNGLRTDAPSVEHFESVVTELYEQLGSALEYHGLTARKGDGTFTRKLARVRELVHQCYPGAKKTKGGQIPTDSGTIELCKHPHLTQYADYSAISSLRSKDLPILRQWIVHAHYDSVKKTGRTGSSKPNVQNFKRDNFPKGDPNGISAKACFRPPNGWLYLSADYDSFELCSVADVCFEWFGFSTLREEINAGIDPHSTFGSNILGVTYDSFKAAVKARVQKAIDARQTAKVFNFGAPGGLGPDKLVDAAWRQYRVDITREQAVQLKQQWLQTRPEFRLYFDRANNRGGTVTHLRSGRVRSGLRYTQCCNSPFQGLAADAAKNAGWYLMLACMGDGPLGSCRVVLFEHDAFMLEIPDDQWIHERGLELQRIMVGAAQEYIRNVTVRAKPVATRYWKKGAEPTYERGRLVCTV